MTLELCHPPTPTPPWTWRPTLGKLILHSYPSDLFAFPLYASFHDFNFSGSSFRARPSTKVAKVSDATDVTSARKAEVPPTLSTSTSTKMTPSVAASTGVTIAAMPPLAPEAELTTQAQSSRATKPQPAAPSEYDMTSTS